MKKFFQIYGLLIYISLPLIILDQVSKVLVRTKIAVGESVIPIEWLPFFRFYHTKNDGVAFGFLQGAGWGWVFAILAVIISIGIIYFFPKVEKKDQFIRFALALTLTGAIGNLIDRVTVGSVTDFVSVGNFAIFNVADMSITFGTAFLIIGFLLQEIREKKVKPEAGASAEKNEHGNGK